jgi:hypothetical protein
MTTKQFFFKKLKRHRISRNPVLAFFDFWFSDFDWYRRLTVGSSSWYSVETKYKGVVEKYWMRDDKNLFKKLELLVKQEKEKELSNN